MNSFAAYVKARFIGNGDIYRYQTTNFKLYLYESSSRSWCKVENIGENVLFLGLNTSISIASSYLPPGGYYKGNRIYFTDDNIDEHIVGAQGGYDIGFYDLDSRRITPLRCNNNDKYRKWTWPTPIWYIYNPEDFIVESFGACDKDEEGDLGLLDLFSCN
ncbi:hypothetical protein A4A49_55439 [Nicotiana attenuata]|uniref:KIB1-4 beta-propeller domain-containing protein n=1 Tax=Nicotiana attenuata TaxID=49451 RepID=A0A1J6KIJ2_NICAT|nr:hypothetical protein A4A49_55439 [Nicotiana attenuata]